MSTRMRLLVCVAAAFCLLPYARAQSGIVVAAFGYHTPGKTIVAAPGQVMTVSVFGIATRFPDPIFPTPVNGLPTEIEGISAEFVQGSVSLDLPLRALQQTPCPPPATCLPATTLTLQIPFELAPDSRDRAMLKIRENGAIVAAIDIDAVPDSVHVLNTCDQTRVYLSLAFDVPAGSCMPMVTHVDGKLVRASLPAKSGETLVVWAYGLGAVSRPTLNFPDQFPLAIQPVTVGLSYANPGRSPWRRLGPVVPWFAGMPGGGLYQVHFIVPPAPQNLAPCSSASGNLKLLLTGPTSADAAEICLE